MPEERAQGGKAGGTLAEELLTETEKPLTMKDRLVGVLIALAMFGLAAGMFIRPVLLGGVDSGDISGRKTRRLMSLIELAWSRPVGGLLVLVGLLVVWGSLTKRSASKN